MLVPFLEEGEVQVVRLNLITRGVKTFSARDACNLGLSDEEQLAFASKNNLVIVTDDDFLSMGMEFEHSGITYVHQEKYKGISVVLLISTMKRGVPGIYHVF
ncbi:MAG: hypothetical protein HW390_1700 [Candidatus Brocadiaceae bacterium]|nr:hypothetical protein [Candidatus Brocadiaceae bacterium]